MFIDESLLNSANGVSNKKGKGSQELAPGTYPVVVTNVFTEPTKAGQAQLTFELSPCVDPNDPSTASVAAAMYHNVMLPELEDQSAWVKAFEEKYQAGDSSIADYARLGVERGAEAMWKDRAKALYSYNKNFAIKDLRTIVGSEVIGSLPKLVEDEDGKKQFIRDGKPVANDVINREKTDIVRAAIQTASAIKSGKLDVTGRVLFMAVKAGDYNGKTSNKIAFISDKPIAARDEEV